MFEPTNYDHHISEYSALIEDIENDVYYDISHLLNNHNRLYIKDKYKCGGFNINIIYPQYSHPEFKKILIDSDSVRFLLSLYPMKEDLCKISSVMIRPRYIELNGIELLSLYVRKERTLVLYLHHPHLYSGTNSRFFDFSDTIQRTGILNPAQPGLLYKNPGKDKFIIQIPPLWYFISTISQMSDNKIEKFFVKRDNKSQDFQPGKISDISFYYSRLGY